MRFIFCLLFLIIVASTSFASQDVIDLGETGFSCPLETRKLAHINNVYQNVDLKPINLSYKNKLAKHAGAPIVKHLKFKKSSGIPKSTKIFVFSSNDEESIELAPKLAFDYGLCLEYNSLDDIEALRLKTGIKQPVQIANDEIISSFGITSYPALITVRKDEFEIQEGF